MGQLYYRTKQITSSIQLCIFWLSALIFIASCDNPEQQESTAEKTSALPSFTISVLPLLGQPRLPALQACAWARQGDKVLLIGGRIEGFHGLSGPNIFTSRKANTSLFVIDLSILSFSELALDKTNPKLLQFFSSNMQFCQDGDSLYIVGGFGLKMPTDAKSNHTFDQLVMLSVSKTIKAVEQKTDITEAIVATATSPFLQVAGGDMIKVGETFYLMFGQKFEGEYTPGKTGEYTNAVRKFRLAQGMITDTSSYIDKEVLHRRDLPFAPVIQKAGIFYAAFGGVFTDNDDGFANPVYVNLNPFSVKQDTMQQMTNQYVCAIATL